MSPSPLLVNHAYRLIAQAGSAPVLDLACGLGRNGLYLAELGQPVVFADRKQEKLDSVTKALPQRSSSEQWLVDFEEGDGNPLAGRIFGGIVVFRYLHRPLMDAIKDGVAPGGLIIYETFTEHQSRYGRPHNPAFLLREGELRAFFDDWKIEHYFEGVTISESNGNEQAIAQVVARRPAKTA